MILLSSIIWNEQRKVLRSKMLPMTIVGSILLPLGIAFLVFVSKNPDLARKLGLVSAKANLMASGATNWPTFLNLMAQGITAGGFFLFVFIISWVFGREFTDGTLKDMLAVPVQRSIILLAKFIVVLLWAITLAIVMFVLGLVMGTLIELPQGTPGLIVQDGLVMAAATLLVILVALPFALFAGIGRGYLLPIAVAIVALVFANIISVAGWGEFFPWAIPTLYASNLGKGVSLSPISFWIVLFTGLAGVVATYFWWKYADQSH